MALGGASLHFASSCDAHRHLQTLSCLVADTIAIIDSNSSTALQQTLPCWTATAAEDDIHWKSVWRTWLDTLLLRLATAAATAASRSPGALKQKLVCLKLTKIYQKVLLEEAHLVAQWEGEGHMIEPQNDACFLLRPHPHTERKMAAMIREDARLSGSWLSWLSRCVETAWSVHSQSMLKQCCSIRSVHSISLTPHPSITQRYWDNMAAKSVRSAAVTSDDWGHRRPATTAEDAEKTHQRWCPIVEWLAKWFTYSALSIWANELENWAVPRQDRETSRRPATVLAVEKLTGFNLHPAVARCASQKLKT